MLNNSGVFCLLAYVPKEKKQDSLMSDKIDMPVI